MAAYNISMHQSDKVFIMPTQSSVLTKALLNAAKEMNISITYLGKIIGKDRSTFSRSGIRPDSKSGELALMLIRCYRSLYVLVGGNSEHIRRWMHTQNKGTQGIPVEQVLRIDGLVRVTEYLDAMRGKS